MSRNVPSISDICGLINFGAETAHWNWNKVQMSNDSINIRVSNMEVYERHKKETKFENLFEKLTISALKSYFNKLNQNLSYYKQF